MTAVELLSHPFAQRLTWTLAHFVWQGLLIAVALAIVVEVLRPRSVHVRYALSLAALIAMFIVVPLTWVAIGDDVAVVVASEPAVPTDVVTIPAQQSLAAQLTTTTAEWWLVAQPVLFCAWFVGCLLLSVRLLVGWFATQALLRSRVALPTEVVASLARVGWRLQTSIPRVVFASEQVSQAIAIGFFRPLVLLPTAWLLELPPNLLEAVVAHELAHLRRCDLWVNFLQRVAEALLFYHPAIWWLSARLRREREQCCDELAVCATGERLHYVEALEITARWVAVDGRPALSAGFFGEGKMNLLHRVRCVLGMSHERPASLWPASLLLGGLSFALLAAIYAANSAQAVADDDRPAAKKEADRPREGGDRPAAREGDRPREGGDRPAAREGDRPREGGDRPAAREGDRPREGERRPDARPDARPEGRPEARPDVRRPDGPRPEGAPRDGEVRRPAGGGENAELMAVIRQLRAEVSELRAEVARLRGSEAGRRPAGGGDIRVEPRREGDRPRPDADRPREGGDRPRPETGRREGGDRVNPTPDRPNPTPDRPRPEGERREGGDRPKPAGERK